MKYLAMYCFACAALVPRFCQAVFAYAVNNAEIDGFRHTAHIGRYEFLRDAENFLRHHRMYVLTVVERRYEIFIA